MDEAMRLREWLADGTRDSNSEPISLTIMLY